MKTSSPCATAIAKARGARAGCSWLRSSAELSSLLGGASVMLEGCFSCGDVCWDKPEPPWDTLLSSLSSSSEARLVQGTLERTDGVAMHPSCGDPRCSATTEGKRGSLTYKRRRERKHRLGWVPFTDAGGCI